MKLAGVSIKNFKSIREIQFNFPKSGILVLVGENNAGKSNIIRAIDAICGETWYGKEKLEDRDFFQKNLDNQIEIDLYFDDHSRVSFKPQIKDWGLSYYCDWKEPIKKPFGSSIKDDFPCTYLGADRTLDKHLSFYDWTLIGRIRRAFHKRISPEVKDELEEQFKSVIDVFSKVPGFTNFKNDFSKFFSELSPISRSKLNIDFKPFTPSNYFKTMQILAKSTMDEDPLLDLDELGDGARNLVLLSLLRSYAKNFKNSGEINGILALEEPELFLHPQARRHLYFILREIAASGIQVIISTHSSSFIDTEHFDEIGRVVKVFNEEIKQEETSLSICSRNDLVNHCIKTGVPQDKVNINNIVEFYKTTSNIRLNEGFFARCLILVEGETEELVIPEFLQKFGISCDALGISIIPVNGKNQIPKYWRLYSQFNIPIIVIFDNDNSRDKNKSNQNLATCFGVELQDILEFEGFSKIVFSKNQPHTPLLILDTDYETCVKKELGNDALYEAIESQAKELIKPLGNQQKGVLARYICRYLCDNETEFTPQFILKLIELLDDILPMNLPNASSLLDELEGLINNDNLMYDETENATGV